MVPQISQPGGIECESCWTPGASSNMSLAETQQQCRHQLVHRNAAIAATEHVTQDTHRKEVRKTGLSNKWKKDVIGCE